MTTEEEIIYAIWDIVRAGKFNQDDPINERLMRSFLRIHRGKHLNKTYSGGASLPDEVFQYLGELPFTAMVTGEFVSEPLPKIISFNHNYGISADIQGYAVSIVNQEEWRNARFDKHNKHHPLIKIVNNYMIMSPGLNQANQLDDFSATELNTVVNLLGDVAINETIPVAVQAVLVNPDDEPGYDFTSSPYPFPDEGIEDLINSVNAREFGIFLRMKSDTVGNLQDEANPTGSEKEV